jgi:hypothetical protein
MVKEKCRGFENLYYGRSGGGAYGNECDLLLFKLSS